MLVSNVLQSYNAFVHKIKEDMLSKLVMDDKFVHMWAFMHTSLRTLITFFNERDMLLILYFKNFKMPVIKE